MKRKTMKLRTNWKKKSKCQFTCFPRTKVQILTPLGSALMHCNSRAVGVSLLAFLLQKYKYWHLQGVRSCTATVDLFSYLYIPIYIYAMKIEDRGGRVLACRILSKAILLTVISKSNNRCNLLQHVNNRQGQMIDCNKRRFHRSSNGTKGPFPSTWWIRSVLIFSFHYSPRHTVWPWPPSPCVSDNLITINPSSVMGSGLCR